MASILGSAVTLQLRESGTTGSYLTLVCETSSGMDGTASVTTTVTKCSTVQSVATPAYSFTFDGIVETAPSGSQVSYEQLLAWFGANTLLDFKRENPVASGTNFYLQGTGYLSALSEAAPAEGNVTFTGTLVATGTVDLTP
ncbi:MAG TPA: hypothetical protein VFV31_00620 [Chitinophagaceae bacterium]|nr:hypothetical protein [Chitinophagaceae bacterium]